MSRLGFATGLLALFAATSYAQDTRRVFEPSIPPICSTLNAQISAVSGRISPDDERHLDTERIQHALDSCGRGRAVALRAVATSNAFLSGPLQLRDGVTLLIEKGATLFASRDASLYQTAPGSCGIVNNAGRGCKPLISADHIKSASLMGDGVIDGRGGETILGKNDSWWQLAEQARAGGRQQVPRILVTDYADDFTIYRITLRNSPNFHVVYNHGNGFTVWGLKIDTPQRLSRNTDGVDPGNGSKNITITHSYIRTGDDNVAIKGGPGGVSNVSVIHNHFYWGHGMSIGSETDGGVSSILVDDLSLDGPDNGIRIKSNASRGGLVHGVTYRDICIRNSPNPIQFDTGYTAAGSLQGTSLPTYKDINFHNVRIFGGGKVSFNGYSSDHRAGVNLDDVLVEGPTPYIYSINHADLHLGPGPVNLKLNGGTDSTLSGQPSDGKPASCTSMFVPFP